jgi:signal transduction histidine kinase
MDYARGNSSYVGEYAALHAKATILLQKQDYDAAEKAFLEAVNFRHKYFPNESAGDDLQELMKIANHRKDGKAGAKYARQILEEPNVAPIHKGRALFRLSQMAFNQNDVSEFNRIYEEMMNLKQTDGIGTLKPVLEVNHCIINGDYQQALRLADELEPEASAERKAVIYHRMGDDTNAYKYMQVYKRISDSITLVSHGNVVASCYVQMNNDRLLLEQHLLEQQNNRLRTRLYLSVGITCILVLLFILFRRQKTIKLLKKANMKLKNKQADQERTLENIADLSKYERQTVLPLTTTVQPNVLCHHLTDELQRHSRRGVSVLFMTQVPDSFSFITNSDALEKLLRHLLNNALRFTQKGKITLQCADAGAYIRFSVTDGSSSPGILSKLTDDDGKAQAVSMTYNICHSISRLLRGRIWIDKEYTKGTRFVIELPKEPYKL